MDYKKIPYTGKWEYHWKKGLNERLTELEEALIRKALQESGGNIALAGRIMGIERTSLIYKLQKLGINPDDYKAWSQNSLVDLDIHSLPTVGQRKRLSDSDGVA